MKNSKLKITSTVVTTLLTVASLIWSPSASSAATSKVVFAQNSDGEILHWDPCLAIGIRVNMKNAPSTAEVTIRNVVTELQKATGLSLEYLGTLSDAPETSRDEFGITMDFQTLIQFRTQSDVKNSGGQVDKINFHVSENYIKTANLQIDPTLKNERKPASLRQKLLHQFGHSFGLLDSKDKSMLMYKSLDSSGAQNFTAVELQALSGLGKTQCAEKKVYGPDVARDAKIIDCSVNGDNYVVTVSTPLIFGRYKYKGLEYGTGARTVNPITSKVVIPISTTDTTDIGLESAGYIAFAGSIYLEDLPEIKAIVAENNLTGVFSRKVTSQFEVVAVSVVPVPLSGECLDAAVGRFGKIKQLSTTTISDLSQKLPASAKGSYKVVGIPGFYFSGSGEVNCTIGARYNLWANTTNSTDYQLMSSTHCGGRVRELPFPEALTKWYLTVSDSNGVQLSISPVTVHELTPSDFKMEVTWVEDGYITAEDEIDYATDVFDSFKGSTVSIEMQDPKGAWRKLYEKTNTSTFILGRVDTEGKNLVSRASNFRITAVSKSGGKLIWVVNGVKVTPKLAVEWNVKPITKGSVSFIVSPPMPTIELFMINHGASGSITPRIDFGTLKSKTVKGASIFTISDKETTGQFYLYSPETQTYKASKMTFIIDRGNISIF